MERYISFTGLFLLAAVGWLLSRDRKRINFRLVAWGIALQMIFAVIILKTPVGRAFFAWVNDVIVNLLSFTDKGVDFVFGPFHAGQKVEFGSDVFSFAFKILPTIIFFSAFMTVLYHLGIMQRIVVFVAKIMAKTMKTSGAESLSAAANIFVGQTEAPLVIKPFVANMTLSELMAVMTGGMATVAGGVMAAYVGILRPYFPDIAGHLLAASIMSAPAALVMAKMMIPEDSEPETAGKVEIQLESVDANIIDAAARGSSEGLQLALNVGAMLLAFIALIYMFNAVLLFSGDTMNIYALGRDPYKPVIPVAALGGGTIAPGDSIRLFPGSAAGIDSLHEAKVREASTRFEAAFKSPIPMIPAGLTFRVTNPEGSEIARGTSFKSAGTDKGVVTVDLYGEITLPAGSTVSFLSEDNPYLKGKGEKGMDRNIVLDVASATASSTLVLAEGLYTPSVKGASFSVVASDGSEKIASTGLDCGGGIKINLEVVLGWLFFPFAFIMGVPLKDCNIIGMLLGEKIVLNEFYAYSHLGRMLASGAHNLSERSIIIASYALCGFANFQSIAIQIGGIGGIAPSRRHDLAKLGIKSMIAGSIAAFMTATIAGFLI